MSNISTHPSYNPTVFPDVYKVRPFIGSDNLERFKRQVALRALGWLDNISYQVCGLVRKILAAAADALPRCLLGTRLSFGVGVFLKYVHTYGQKFSGFWNICYSSKFMIKEKVLRYPEKVLYDIGVFTVAITLLLGGRKTRAIGASSSTSHMTLMVFTKTRTGVAVRVHLWTSCSQLLMYRKHKIRWVPMFANHRAANLTTIIAPIKVCCGVHTTEVRTRLSSWGGRGVPWRCMWSYLSICVNRLFHVVLIKAVHMLY